MDRSRFDGWESFMDCSGLAVVAGPCSAESREQVLRTAEALGKAGVSVFRAGVWKPRTRPGNFEGAGDSALPWLAEARAVTGMKVGTEVASGKHVEAVLGAGLDFVWIGARTVTNPFLVQEIADSLKSADIPVFIKNPVNPDLELWAGAIERIRHSGIGRIAAVHRGVTSYSRMIYRNDPHWQMAIALRLRFPALPMFCDPSHIAGDRKYVGEIAAKAMDLDFDGLFIESHIEPREALSDAAQQLTPDDLSSLLSSIEPKENGCAGSPYRESLPVSVFDIGYHVLQVKDHGDSYLYVVADTRVGLCRCMLFDADILHGTDSGSLQIGIKIVIDKTVPVVQFSADGNSHVFREVPAELNQYYIVVFPVCRIISAVCVQNHILNELLYLACGCKGAEADGT